LADILTWHISSPDIHLAIDLRGLLTQHQRHHDLSPGKLDICCRSSTSVTMLISGI
jgi:hypothetical protein